MRWMDEPREHRYAAYDQAVLEAVRSAGVPVYFDVDTPTDDEEDRINRGAPLCAHIWKRTGGVAWRCVRCDRSTVDWAMPS